MQMQKARNSPVWKFYSFMKNAFGSWRISKKRRKRNLDKKNPNEEESRNRKKTYLEDMHQYLKGNLWIERKIKEQNTYFSSINISTAFSFAALRTPVIVPPARPAAYARSIEGYFTLSGALNVSEPSLHNPILIDEKSEIIIYRIRIIEVQTYTIFWPHGNSISLFI